MKKFAIAIAIFLMAGMSYAQLAPTPTPPLNGLPGQAAGPLTAGGRVPDNQLSISAFQYRGVWNAATNTPSLADGIGTTGDTYEIGTSGTQNLGSGSVDYLAGNLLLYNGTVWQQAGSGNIPVPANPTSSVGTSAVNGVASTFMRSDAAPAINQGISPTWTAAHQFNFPSTATAPSVQLSSTNPQLELRNTTGATDTERWGFSAGSSIFKLWALNDAGTSGSDIWSVNRSGTSATQQQFLTGGTSRFTITNTDLAAGSGYTPANPLSLATKSYVDTRVPSTVASGTYTPTITCASCSASSASGPFSYTQIGSVVSVAGTLDLTASTSGNTTLTFTLPVASTFTTVFQLNGTGTVTDWNTGNFNGGAISYGNSNPPFNNVGVIYWNSASANRQLIRIVFSYTVQ